MLESIYRPITAMLDWELGHENDNRAIINNDIDYMYRYPDIPNNKLDTIVSILMLRGGMVSKSKRMYFLKYMEELSVKVISGITNKLKVGVTKVMSNEH